MERQELSDYYKQVRQQTEKLCKPLQTEDYIPQPVVDVSPPRWHLAHTTWFFEIMALQKFVSDYKLFNEHYPYIFNSYYHSLGERWDRAKRGQLSRPTVKEVYEFRAAINERMQQAINDLPEEKWLEFSEIVKLGLNHEHQHQELLLYDLKYILCNNPLFPAYLPRKEEQQNVQEPDKTFVQFEGGLHEIGYNGTGFSYDNEHPRHKVYLEPFALRKSLVTNGEFMEFMKDRGYQNYALWLGEGYDLAQQEGWKAPFYWINLDNEWHEITLHGLQKVQPNNPVTHISFYEAEAFASWSGNRLPTEQEWEVAANQVLPDFNNGIFSDDEIYHPTAPKNLTEKLHNLAGNLWEWTNSAYLPYPGYKQEAGPLGEYNGKFMINQMVLRGGSLATPRNHYRTTYRNFFHPDKRWIFSGIRLAQNTLNATTAN